MIGSCYYLCIFIKMMSFFPLKTVVPEIFFTQMHPTLASVSVFKHFQKNFLIKLKGLSKFKAYWKYI